MTRGRPKVELVMTGDERAQITSFARGRSLPASLSARARSILSGAEGEGNSVNAKRMKVTKATVSKFLSE